MTILISEPTRQPGDKVTSCRVVSDESLQELLTFVGRLGLRLKDSWRGDHYRVGLRRYEQAIRLGAVEVGLEELLRRSCIGVSEEGGG